MASCRNFGSGIKTKLVLQFSKGARKCLFNLSNLKLSFHAGKSVRMESVWLKPTDIIPNIAPSNTNKPGWQGEKVVMFCVYLCGLAAKIN